MKSSFIFTLTLVFSVMGFSQQPQNFKNLTEAENGFIGINTTEPDAMLTVKGAIHTQEVNVDLDGAVAPDYVFEAYFWGHSTLNPAYRFLSLEAIEHFIKQNHHLPKVPSSEELASEGLSLKQMNLLLLEKIEELTLHTISQQKQLEALSKRLEALESEKN